MISLQVQTKSACQHALFMLRGETKSAQCFLSFFQRYTAAAGVFVGVGPEWAAPRTYRGRALGLRPCDSAFVFGVAPRPAAPRP